METKSEIRHVMLYILTPILILLGGIVGLFVGTHYATDTVVYDYQVALEGPEGDPIPMQYGVWPELANVDFFKKVREGFITQKANFIEANLTAMEVRVYENGSLLFTVPIKSKGKEGSWWETPSGLYRAEGKEESHFSSFGHVYMPWSIPFQGNFFIHGWPVYPDGTPVREGYSGGCIRLEDVYAKQVYEHIVVGTPILVFEEEAHDSFSYILKAPEVQAKSYLVVDLENNFVLVSSDTEKKTDNYLLSKMMTAVVSSEFKNIEEKILIKEELSQMPSPKRLTAGSSYALYDLFFPLLLEDSDEVARAIHDFFGVNRFLSLMHTKASALGMKNTSFEKTPDRRMVGNTTSGDVFLFLKYLYTNRPFILTMSANKTNTRTYGEPIFKDILPVHPFVNKEDFLGGMANATSTNIAQKSYSQEASVALVFADTKTQRSHSEDDLISVFSIPFNGEERTIGFVVFDSPTVIEDTEALLLFAQSLYQ